MWAAPSMRDQEGLYKDRSPDCANHESTSRTALCSGRRSPLLRNLESFLQETTRPRPRPAPQKSASSRFAQSFTFSRIHDICSPSNPLPALPHRHSHPAREPASSTEPFPMMPTLQNAKTPYRPHSLPRVLAPVCVSCTRKLCFPQRFPFLHSLSARHSASRPLHRERKCPSIPASRS